MSFRDKNILVTGGGGGIGRAICLSLASSGANVYVVGRTQANLDTLRATESSINTKCLDITDFENLQRYIGSLPPLDGLVNNAAVAVIKPFLEISPTDYDAQMETNLKAAYFVAQAAARNMVQHARAGSIVHVSSQASQAALASHSLYGMSKAALDNLAKNMALELGPHGIRANCVNPTVVLTDMGRENWSEEAKARPMLDKIPLGRFAEVDEVVGPVLFLLGQQSSMVNGTTLNVDGGFLASTQFRVKKIFLTDIHTRGFAIEVTRLDNDTHTMMLSKDEAASQDLVAKSSPMTKKKLVLKECPCYNDIKIDLYENQGDKQVFLTTYEVRGVKEAVEKRITNSKYNLTNISKDMPKVVVWLAGDTNNTGIVTISKAEIVIEGSYWLEVNETVPKKKDNATDAPKEGSEGSEEKKEETAADGEAKAEGEEKKEEEKAEGDEEKKEEKVEENTTNTTNTSNASNKTPSIEYETITVMKKKNKKFTDNLKLVVIEHKPRPMNHEELHAAIESLKAAQQKDEDAKKLDGTANELESYIYSTRDKLESESWIGVTTEEIRTELSELLTSTDEWLQEGASGRTLQDFEGKLQALQGKADPIQERAMELEYRPDVIDWVKEELEEANKWHQLIIKNMTWIDANKTKKVGEKIDEFVAWWNKVQEKQKTTPVQEAPAFTREEVRTKMKEVTSEIDKLKKIPKPKEKKEKKDKGKGKDKKGKGKAKGKDEKVDIKGWDLDKVEAELKRIDDEKAAAIKNEDYDKAASLKTERSEMEKKLEALKEAAKEAESAPAGVDTTGWDVAKAEAELTKLDADKAAATAAEDYDKAAELKKKKEEVEAILKALKDGKQEL